MAEAKGPTVTANKLAMSRALGAAFLSHQVEQLEKTVSNGPSSVNWRDRRQAQMDLAAHNARGGGTQKRPNPTSGAKPTRRSIGEVIDRDRTEVKHRRQPTEDRKETKDADVIVVDASVLVHALYQVKRWCRDGRTEIIVIPLEALNTLDLLKKGTSALAQRARAASRILEAQVGANSRIHVQRDDAFVLWDRINFKDLSTSDTEKQGESPPNQPPPGNSPEWVRRVICCARWEVENRNIEGNTEEESKDEGEAREQKLKVVLAVLSSSPQSSPQAKVSKLSEERQAVPTSPVPLPAPHPHKHEPRSSGILVSQWAARAGIEMLEIQPTAPASNIQPAANGRPSEDEEKVHRSPGRPHPHSPHAGKGRRNSQHTISSPVYTGGNPGLVERPPAVMAMMELVSQPSKVVRVLARGEKLDPDP